MNLAVAEETGMRGNEWTSLNLQGKGGGWSLSQAALLPEGKGQGRRGPQRERESSEGEHKPQARVWEPLVSA